MAKGKKEAAVGAGPVEGLWDLPDDWRWERLDTVAPVNPRRNFEGVPGDAELAFLGMAAVSELNGSLDLSEKRPLVSVRSGFTRFRSGDVIFAKITPCMENGKLAIIPDLPHGMGAGSTEFHVLEPQQVSASYLFHWLSQETFRNRAEHNMTGTAGQKRVPTDWLRNAPIPVPPSIDEQDAIVARIDTLWADIDDGEAALADARAGVATYRKALLKAAVTGELTADWRQANPPQETGEQLLSRILADRRTRWQADPKNARKKYAEPAGPDTYGLPELPKGWTWATVEQLGTVSGGITQNSKRQALAMKLPFLRVANVYANRLDLRVIEEIGLQASELDRVQLVAGDLLVVEGNGSIDQIGRSCLWDGSIVPCVHQNHLIKVRFGLSEIGPWVQTWLQSPHGRRELEEQASSTSGLHTLSISKVGGLRVPIPPMAEVLEAQQRRVQMNDQQIDATYAIEEQVRQSSTLRQSILAAAFRGELAA